MELIGEELIRAPRGRVWSALNDPAVLARCIEGAQSLERVGENRFEGRVAAKVGPVRATFAGVVELSRIDPPNGYTLTGEGKGGAAGFAKGGADIALADDEIDGEPATRLTYTARASVGGKLAQLGGRLIEGAARGQADRFFGALKAELERDGGAASIDGGAGIASGAAPAEAAAMPEVQPAPVATPPGRGGLPLFAWVALLSLAVVALLAYLLSRP